MIVSRSLQYSHFVTAGYTTMNITMIEVVPSVCLESITCVSSTNGTCVVYIGRNKSDALSRMSTTGAINSSISFKDNLLSRKDTFYVAQFYIGQLIETNGVFSTIEGKYIILN